MSLTLEQIDELAIVLEMACDEWIARGGRIDAIMPMGSVSRSDCACPFGALMGERVGCRYPAAEDIAAELGIPYIDALAFTVGFDEGGSVDDVGIALGRYFRDKYCRVQP
jgi:hypothetical protein